jgi:hypothetical protein
MKAFNTFQMAKKGRIIQFDIFMRGKNSKDLNCLGFADLIYYYTTPNMSLPGENHFVVVCFLWFICIVCQFLHHFCVIFLLRESN